MSINLSRYAPKVTLDSVAANDEVERPVRFYGMGMAGIAANDDMVSVYASDRPEAHIREARDIRNYVEQLLSSAEGRQIQHYLRSKSGTIAEIVGYYAGDFEHDGIVAAVAHDGKKGNFFVNTKGGRNLEDRAWDLAQRYQTGSDNATLYAVIHEVSHLAGYDEEQIEPVVAEVAEHMMNQYEPGSPEFEKYAAVKSIAEQRQMEKEGYREAA